MQRHFYNQVLREGDRQVLKHLGDLSGTGFYLAGGTGLAIQLGHRLSYDLDFFCAKPFAFRNDFMKQRLREAGTVKLFQDSNGTIEAAVNETRVTFLYYDYPMAGDYVSVENIRIASVLDIGLMKLSALSSRGSRKDFIDLFFIKEDLPVRSLFEKFDMKYKGSGYNPYHMLKSLDYFDDAEREPMPAMISPVDWDEVKRYFKQEKRHLSGTLL